MKEESDLENDISTCLICLEGRDENNELKQINCKCLMYIHKECLEEYIYNKEMEQTCPVCGNNFSPEYEFEETIKCLDKGKIKLDKLFCKEYNNDIINFFCKLSYFILHLFYFVTLFVVGIVLFCLMIILLGYILKFLEFLITLRFDPNFTGLHHFQLGIFGLLIFSFIYILKKKDCNSEKKPNIINF